MTPIHAGVIGCGRWGRQLVRNLARLGVLSGVCDRDTERTRTVAREYSVPALSLDEMLADDAITAVAIATPAELHTLQVRQALQAGKHTFVEKPLALTITDAEGLKSLAARERRVLMVGHVLHYHPAFIALLQILSRGELGELSQIRAHRLSEDGAQREWNTLWGMASHDISMTLAIAGCLPERVTSRLARPATGSLADGAPEILETRLEFGSGLYADITVSGMSAGKVQRLEVEGSRGIAVFDDCRPWDAKLTLQPRATGRNSSDPGTPIPLQAVEPLYEECRHFLDIIRHGGACRTGPDESIPVLCVLEAAELSLKLQYAVNLTDLWQIGKCVPSPFGGRLGLGVKNIQYPSPQPSPPRGEGE